MIFYLKSPVQAKFWSFLIWYQNYIFYVLWMFFIVLKVFFYVVYLLKKYLFAYLPEIDISNSSFLFIQQKNIWSSIVYNVVFLYFNLHLTSGKKGIYWAMLGDSDCYFNFWNELLKLEIMTISVFVLLGSNPK